MTGVQNLSDAYVFNFVKSCADFGLQKLERVRIAKAVEYCTSDYYSRSIGAFTKVLISIGDTSK